MEAISYKIDMQKHGCQSKKLSQPKFADYMYAKKTRNSSSNNYFSSKDLLSFNERTFLLFGHSIA